MFPNVNDMLYILPSSSKDRAQYKARVSELDDDCLWIEIPIQENTGMYGLFAPGEMLEITFHAQDGMNCLFVSKVIGKRKEGIQMLSIVKPHPNQITKMQRRSFLRVDSALEVAVRTEKRDRFVVHTEDISGGSASLIVEHKWGLQAEDLVECWFVIPLRNDELDYVPFKGKVLRVQERNDKYALVIVLFTEIHEHAQQKIVRYCFERQLQTHKGDL